MYFIDFFLMMERRLNMLFVFNIQIVNNIADNYLRKHLQTLKSSITFVTQLKHQ